NQKYLEAFGKAERDLPVRLARLKEWLRDTPSQLERLERVEALSQERLAGLKSIISNADPDTLSQRMTQGNTVADSIDREFADMRAEEARLWGQRIASETGLRRKLSMAMYGGAILSLLAG